MRPQSARHRWFEGAHGAGDFRERLGVADGLSVHGDPLLRSYGRHFLLMFKVELHVPVPDRTQGCMRKQCMEPWRKGLFVSPCNLSEHRTSIVSSRNQMRLGISYAVDLIISAAVPIRN